MEICSTPSRPVHPPSPSSLPAQTQGLGRLAGGGANSRRLRPSTSRWGSGAGPGGQVGNGGQGGLGPVLKPWALPGAWQKLQEYLSGRSILAKLQAKHEKLQDAIRRGGPPLPRHPQGREQPSHSVALLLQLLPGQRVCWACRKEASQGPGPHPALCPAAALTCRLPHSSAM